MLKIENRFENGLNEYGIIGELDPSYHHILFDPKCFVSEKYLNKFLIYSETATICWYDISYIPIAYVETRIGVIFLAQWPRAYQLRRKFSEMAHPIDLIPKMSEAQWVDTWIKVCFKKTGLPVYR